MSAVFAGAFAGAAFAEEISEGGGEGEGEEECDDPDGGIHFRGAALGAGRKTRYKAAASMARATAVQNVNG